MKTSPAFALLATLLLAPAGDAQTDTPVRVGGRDYANWAEWIASPEFRQSGRCGSPSRDRYAGVFESASDCTLNSSNPSALYDPADPSAEIYEIRVVVHVIENTGGSGSISDSLVRTQIDILNEDFRALAGTNGALGADTGIQFSLATLDPQGNPTTGITHTVNSSWFNDFGSYYNTLAWDPDQYLNIYTNSASGALGYVPGLPQSGLAGQNNDRVVVLWSSFGRNSPIGPPFNLGRTSTHEVGHYLGLYHTFDGGCGTSSSPGCRTSGDLVCDTNSESSPNFGCSGPPSCGSSDPVDNYMDYSDDVCMTRFTPEQANRMRCTLVNYRPGIYATVASDPGIEFYCTGKTTSLACVPFLETTGAPSETSTDAFQITGRDHLPSEAGLLVYGFARGNLNFHGGKLCVKAPFVRTTAKVAKNVTSATCPAGTVGRLRRDFNNVIQSGIEPMLTVGQDVTAQWLQRDPANTVGGFGDNLTDGVEFTILP